MLSKYRYISSRVNVNPYRQSSGKKDYVCSFLFREASLFLKDCYIFLHDFASLAACLNTQFEDSSVLVNSSRVSFNAINAFVININSTRSAKIGRTLPCWIMLRGKEIVH